MRRMVPIEERFWRFVPERPENECWPWYGNRDHSGYGRIHESGRGSPVRRAHCVSWEIHHGPIPDGKRIAHTCDRPDCTNPSHLLAVTPAEAQRMARRRLGNWNARGEHNGRSTITNEQVAQIRNLSARGAKQREIAELIGCAQSTVSNILAGRRRR